MSRKLVISDGTRERELQVVDRLVVGRDPSCDISADHSLLSRRHAEFVTVSDGVTVRDLGSRNGVFVNGTRAAERALAPGDVVQIGPLRARYVVDAAPLSIIPDALDDDRTAMLRAPATGASAGAAPMPAPVSAVPRVTAPVLADTVVPQHEPDEDVTRMVPGPLVPPVEEPPAAFPQEEEVTRFTPGPGGDAAPLASAPPVDVAEPLAAPPPAAAVEIPPATAVQPNAHEAAAPSAIATDVLVHTIGLAVAVAVVSASSLTMLPGMLGGIVALVAAGAGGFVVGGMINRRVDSMTARSFRDRS